MPSADPKAELIIQFKSKEEIDCAPFENPRQAYIWMRNFTGKISKAMYSDLNHPHTKSLHDFESARTFATENHAIHLSAARCAAIVKFTFDIGDE
jgi:hypothetical protein